MTPQDVRRLRTAFGFTQTELAGLVGVAPSTVSRWESHCLPLRVEPLQSKLLLLLAKHELRASDLGQTLRSALATHGGLAAIHVLLRAEYGDP